MGKAIIIEYLGYSKYVVDIIRDSPLVRARIRNANAEIARIEAEIPTLYSSYVGALSRSDSLKDRYEQDQIRKDSDVVSKYFKEYIEAFSETENAYTKYYTWNFKVVELSTKVANWEKEIAPRRDSAWVSTYVSDLKPGDEVSTIECARNTEYPYSVIAPLGEAYTDSYGMLRSVRSMTASQAYLNYALLPGATKWKRRYALATVLGVDVAASTLRVFIETVSSATVYIDEEPTSELTLPYIKRCPASVKCEYFLGDKVLVEYDGSTPHAPLQVVGWAEWPRRCISNRFLTMEAIATVSFTGDYSEMGVPLSTYIRRFQQTRSHTFYPSESNVVWSRAYLYRQIVDPEASTGFATEYINSPVYDGTINGDIGPGGFGGWIRVTNGVYSERYPAPNLDTTSPSKLTYSYVGFNMVDSLHGGMAIGASVLPVISEVITGGYYYTRHYVSPKIIEKSEYNINTLRRLIKTYAKLSNPAMPLWPSWENVFFGSAITFRDIGQLDAWLETDHITFAIRRTEYSTGPTYSLERHKLEVAILFSEELAAKLIDPLFV